MGNILWSIASMEREHQLCPLKSSPPRREGIPTGSPAHWTCDLRFPAASAHTQGTCGWCFAVAPEQADRLASVFCIPVGGATLRNPSQFIIW